MIKRWLESYKAIIIVFLIVIIVAGGVMLIYKPTGGGEGLEIVLSSPSCQITFCVIGAVESPGIYTFEGCNLCIQDAVNAADGFTDDADQDVLNLVASLSNGDVIHIPCLGDVPQRININTADVWLLEALRGIGPTLAERIVHYRSQNGPFQRIEDLMMVDGIGQAKYDGLKDLIAVE